MDINGIMKTYKIKIKNPVIGVPITFLDKYCPEQFEILWTTDRGGDGMLEDIKVLSFDKSWDSAWVNGSKVYKRIFIRHKK